jgi:hypothetical protein
MECQAHNSNSNTTTNKNNNNANQHQHQHQHQEVKEISSLLRRAAVPRKDVGAGKPLFCMLNFWLATTCPTLKSSELILTTLW